MSTYMQLTLPEFYPWVLLTAGMVSFECVIIGFTAGGSRGKLFSTEFMQTHFSEAHKKAFKKAPPSGGYPDHGNGVYGDKLTYKDWFEFSIAQRAHKNFLEQVTIVVFSILAAGVTLPYVAVAVGALYFIGRLIFAIGYIRRSSEGTSKGRVLGTIICIVSVFVLLALALYSSWDLYDQFSKVQRENPAENKQEDL